MLKPDKVLQLINEDWSTAKFIDYIFGDMKKAAKEKMTGAMESSGI